MQILEHILKIRREKEKHEFSQTVGNHLALRNFLFALRNLQCGFRIAKFRIAKFRIAKFAVIFRIAKFAMWFSHCEIRCGNSHCEIRSTLRTHCELIAKIPTVLPSDFVLRITFSSELRFRRFWYRWKA